MTDHSNNGNDLPRLNFAGRGIHILEGISGGRRAFLVVYCSRSLKCISYGERRNRINRVKRNRTREEAWDLAVAFLRHYAASHFLTIRQSLEYVPEANLNDPVSNKPNQ